MGAQRKESPDNNTSELSLLNLKLLDYWDWAPKGLCQKRPQEFDTGGNTTYAKMLCDMCPVADQCLAYSLIYNESGIWGGMTEKERTANFSKSFRATLVKEARDQNQYFKRGAPEKSALAALFREFLR